MAIDIIFFALILLFSVIVHEVAHGLVAYSLGDPTAKDAGRLTLNPLSHIDPFGSILLPFFMYLVGGPLVGMAKPVPFNPMYFKNIRQGTFFVAIAGVGANFLMALIFGLVLATHLLGLGPLLAPLMLQRFLAILGTIVQINIVLGVFNLFPIPPLDGSKILFALLGGRLIKAQIFLERYGFLILMAFIFFIWTLAGRIFR
ncbi:MAG: site-2 protease family protein [Candidatus Sungbacteria bacterium]|uniref:Site-2 protease family protein n=1 Tax=Candidatus Sungiibacteriota bacterium TaxID=2750080 RepID=A0A9D6QVP9_9BACT|nr:site-2 protease family protein [Candidatus Sungbacteria bacterium]